MNAQQARLLRAIADAILDAVKAGGPMGTPGGTLYAVLMAHGATLQQYEGIMAGLVQAGMLRKSGNLYFLADSK